MYDLEGLIESVNLDRINLRRKSGGFDDAGICSALTNCPETALRASTSGESLCSRCLGFEINYGDIALPIDEPVTKDNFVDVMTMTLILK